MTALLKFPRIPYDLQKLDTTGLQGEREFQREIKVVYARHLHRCINNLGTIIYVSC